MKKSISILFSILVPGLAVAATADSSVDAYLLALNTISPDVAKFTVQYKEAIESKCTTKLSVEQLKSPDFSNVVSALLFSENVQTLNIDRNDALHDTMNIIGKNLKCNDLNAPFTALLNDQIYQEKHTHLAKILHNLNVVTASTKKD